MNEFGREVIAYVAATYESSTVDRMTREMDERGRKKGARYMGNTGMTYREEGIAKGMAEGEAKFLTLLLEQRFGTLPRSARDRIAAAPIEQLDSWLGHVLEARSLDELLGETKAA